MKNRNHRDRLMVLPEVGDWPKARFGIDPSIAMSAIQGVQGAFQKIQPFQASKPVIVVPGTPPAPKASPAQRVAKILSPISARPPQTIDSLRAMIQIDGSRWADAVSKVSQVAAEEGLGLDIQIGVGDQIFLLPGHIVTTTFSFRLPGR